MRSPLPILALLLNALIWGLSWWPLRLMFDAGLHPLWATALMFALIATIMLLMSRVQGTDQTLVILGALAAVLLLTLIALVAARPLMALLGSRVEAVITRLLGVLLAALAAQYVIDGVKAVLAS